MSLLSCHFIIEILLLSTAKDMICNMCFSNRKGKKEDKKRRRRGRKSNECLEVI